MQKVQFIGNLGKDPEMRYTPNGKAVTNLSVAVNRSYTNSAGDLIKETTWYQVEVWGRLAENCNQYLYEGRRVYVEGRLKPDPETGGPRIWYGDDGNARASFEVRGSYVEFLDGNKNKRQGQARQKATVARGNKGNGNSANKEEFPW